MDTLQPRASDQQKTPNHPVNFSPLAPESMRKERRENARALAEAVHRIKELEDKVYTDNLTGIANDAAFREKLPELIEVAHRNNEPMALLFADVDGLKRTNDSLGHEAGDKLIQAAAGAFSEVVRPGDLPGRLGGDELYVVMPGFTPVEGGSEEELVGRMQERFASAFDESIKALNLPEELHVGVSFAMATLEPGDTMESFKTRADQLMYQHKESRKAVLKEQGVTFQDDRQIA